MGGARAWKHGEACAQASLSTCADASSPMGLIKRPAGRIYQLPPVRKGSGSGKRKCQTLSDQDPYKSLILYYGNWRGNLRSVFFIFSWCLNSLSPPLTMSAILRDVSNIARSPCAAKAKVSTPARVSPQPLPPPRWALDDFEIGTPVGGQNQGSSRRIAWEAA